MTPGYKSFLQIARDGATLIPVARTLNADLLTPVSAFLSMAANEPYAFLLESVEGGERVGRYTFLGARPYMIVIARGEEIEIRRGLAREHRTGPVLPVLRELLAQHEPAQIEGLPPFTAGAVGYVAYDVVRQIEKLPEQSSADLKTPDCVLMFFDRVLAFDHVRHQLYLMAAADVRIESPRKAYDRAVAGLDELERKLAKGLQTQPMTFGDIKAKKAAKLKVHAATGRDDYMSAVRKAKEYIAAGDIFQVVLSQRFDFQAPAAPFEMYRALRTLNPSPYLYFLRMGELEVLGSSPEMLVRVTGRKLEYSPIAGTRARGATVEEDVRLEQELRADEKEKSEHVMLVDLGRNDVGRVSAYGSVRVTDLMRVERYSHVMHLVSSVEGRLRDGLDALDAFASCFPAGTLSGAPKVRAMEIIEELEPVRRGVYGGSVVYADFAGNFDSCIAIRTMVVNKGHAYVQAGAGVVADSVPANEFDECVNKASALMRAAEAAKGSGSL
ncbi:MAG TPA: anthranilate synthase component I [Clostridia bacterium]|nr:anthranilate synthase component I [Clostridia bacterium]